MGKYKMNSKKVVEDFLAQKKIAVVGVSRSKSKFGTTLYNELKKKGYTVFPVNPNTTMIESDVCYPDLHSLPEKADGVIFCVPPSQTENIIKDLKTAGINKVWFQLGSQSEKAEMFCQENNIDCVSNECVLMFAEPTAFFHKAHRWINGLIGKLPA
jgi:predicted CoA-binding protein